MLWRALIAVLAPLVIGFATISLWIPAFIYRPTPLSPSDPTAWGLPGAHAVRFSSGPADHLFGWWLSPPRPEHLSF